MAPAQGFTVHEQDRGPRAEAEGEFRRTADNHDRVKVDVRCGGSGSPVMSERGDD